MSTGPGGSVVVAWECGGSVVGHHVIDPDRVRFVPGPAATSDVTFVAGPGTGPGPTWRLRCLDGSELPIPPDDETPEAAARITPLPDIDLCWNWVLTGGIFGPRRVRYEVRGGTIRSIAHADAAEVVAGDDAWFRFPYRRALEFRARACSITDVVAPPGEVGGDLEAVLVLAGIVDHALTEVLPMQPPDLARLCSLVDHLGGRTLDPPGP